MTDIGTLLITVGELLLVGVVLAVIVEIVAYRVANTTRTHTRKEGTMRLLASLRDVLDDIEAENENAHAFVERLLIELEEGRDFAERPLTGAQFRWLTRLHDRYCR